MSEITVTVRGLAPGERPVAVVEIPLDEKHSEYVEHVLAAVFGRAAGDAAGQDSTAKVD